jgi:hypothetical protein
MNRFLRVLLAGLVALFAVLAVFFTAVLVFFTGLIGAVLAQFRGSRGANPSRPAPPRRSPPGSGEVIDVETTKVPDKPAGS